ncbi:F-box domain-containing protein [Favolaschia claudopus]|uniref:F-box domain-containing protein n=1 Tax=Favolaschia claudopus TaxID=2862362 RepID=A0AAW0BF26_9AGAR
MPEPIPVESSTISKDILDTNNPPAEHDFPALREFVARGSARRAVLDSKISLLKAELDKLLEERNALDVEIQKHEGAISPLRHLPTEILSIIFMYAVQFSFTHQHSMDMKSGPIPLSAVCSRWRRIALSQSSLWTFFPLNFEEAMPELVPVEETLSAVKIHVDRSRDAPLKLVFMPFYEHRITDLEQQVLDLLTPHVARWEEVVFYGTPAIYESLCTWSAEFLALRKLDITVYDQDEFLELDIRNVFAFSPRLEEAFVNIRTSDNTPVVFSLDTSSLRRYGAQNPWRRHVDVLRLASDLVDCVLSVTGSFDPFGTGDKISLPRLCRLAVTDVNPLHVLDTPALRDLYCSKHTADLHGRLRELPRLRKLFVGEPRIPVDLQSFMHSVPALTALCMYLPMNYASALFELLDSSPSLGQDQDTPHLPALHTLGLCFGPENYATLGEPIDQDELMGVVEARWRGGQLRSFQIYVMRFAPSESTLKRMEALRQEGMKFVLETHSMHLYQRMVPPDFCLYDDEYAMVDLMLE